VLIAEDDDAIRRLLAMTLRRHGIHVEVARNGLEALDALQKYKWAAVVLDLMMPEMNGWEVVRWLGSHPEHRPQSLIVVSAADREALKDLDTTIVNAIIFKPFDIVQFGAYVSSVLQHKGRDRRRARVVPTL
jgi:DNA-binding response OmpR family regulator